jgi:hypothetical protein
MLFNKGMQFLKSRTTQTLMTNGLHNQALFRSFMTPARSITLMQNPLMMNQMRFFSAAAAQKQPL